MNTGNNLFRYLLYINGYSYTYVRQIVYEVLDPKNFPGMSCSTFKFQAVDSALAMLNAFLASSTRRCASFHRGVIAHWNGLGCLRGRWVRMLDRALTE